MKTLVIYNSKILGATEEELAIGDIVSIELSEGQSTPLIVHQVLDAPKTIGVVKPTTNQSIIDIEASDEDIVDVPFEENKDYDKIAYLSYNGKASSKYIKKTSQRLEKNMAKTLGGRTTPGSGAFSGHKGDVKSGIWLGEHKYTDATSYRLYQQIWQKIAQESFEVQKTPILEIVLDNSKNHTRLIFMDLHDFYDKTHATEEQFVDCFYITQYVPKKEGGSILLKDEAIQEAIDKSGTKVPGFFLSFHNKLTLFGLRVSDFEKLFQGEEND